MPGTFGRGGDRMKPPFGIAAPALSSVFQGEARAQGAAGHFVGPGVRLGVPSTSQI